MSESLNHPDRNSVHAVPADESRPHKGTSPLLWVVLLLALLAVLYYFMTRSGPVAPTTEPVAPIGDTTPADTATPAATATANRPATPAQRRQAAVPRDRDARPLQQPADPTSPAFLIFLLPLFPPLCHFDTPLSGKA